MSNIATVVVDEISNDGLVLSANLAAKHFGIERSMRLKAALALAPQLQYQLRDWQGEIAALETMAKQLQTISSWVQLRPPNGICLELQASLRLLGGVGKACDAIDRVIRSYGGRQLDHDSQPRRVIACTAQAAFWLAQSGKQKIITQQHDLVRQLHRLSICQLGWPKKTITTLQRLGVGNIGECLRLPRKGLVKRLGAQVVQQLDQALGYEATVIDAWQAPEYFQAEQSLELATVQHRYLKVVIEHLLRCLVTELDTKQQAVTAIQCHFELLNQRQQNITVRFSEPTWQYDHLLRVIDERLQRLKLLAPVQKCRLKSSRWVTRPLANRHFFIEQDNNRSWAQLLEQLQSRLGEQAVLQLRTVADHRPEYAYRALKVRERASEALIKRSRTAHRQLCKQYPLWLFHSAKATEFKKPIMHQSPRRIEGGWWDNNDIARDYFHDVNQQQHRWVFQDRKNPDQWYLHGLFG
ncbi:MAG: DNA polymerase Y family protein [Gammaproteobacteria bacterium]|nr:DNA polymerase Y family protein [Gammaproteobacteria bacterium]